MKPKEYNDIAETLHKHRVTPDAFWVSENRRELLRHMHETAAVPAQARVNVWNRMVDGFHIIISRRFTTVVLRPLMLLLLVVSVAVSGWITTASASPASPVRYSAKLAVEKVEVAFTSKENKPKIHLRNAKRRAEDIKKAPEHADAAIKSLQKSVASVQETVKETVKEKIQNDPGEVGASVKEMKELVQQTQEIADTLKQAQQDVPVDQATQEALEKTTGLVEELADGVVQEVVESVLETGEAGAGSEVTEEVKEMVTGRIDALGENVEGIADLGNLATSTVSSTTQTGLSVPSGNETQIGAPSGTASDTLQIAPTSASGTVAEIGTSVGTNVEQAKEVIAEARTLVEGGEVLKAMEKVKEAKEKVSADTTPAGSAPGASGT